MKRIWNNICHVPTSVLGLAIIAFAGIMTYLEKIPAEGFVAICIGAAYPILFKGKKKTE